MQQITKLQTYLESLIDENDGFDGELTRELLSEIKDTLLTFDEFKDVKKINILPMPIYEAKKGSYIPIANDDTYLGGETDRIETVSYQLIDGECGLNEEIDFYSIRLAPIFYNANAIKDSYERLHKNKIGVYRAGGFYDPDTFTPIDQISITWSTEKIKSSLADLNPSEQDVEVRRRLLKMFEDALDGKYNLPKKRGVIIRISPRSLKEPKQK